MTLLPPTSMKAAEFWMMPHVDTCYFWRKDNSLFHEWALIFVSSNATNRLGTAEIYLAAETSRLPSLLRPGDTSSHMHRLTLTAGTILCSAFVAKAQPGCSADAPSVADVSDFLQTKFDYLVIGMSR